MFYIFAYWYDPQFKSRVGGLIRIFDFADNLKKSGHGVVLFLPKLGSPKKQTVARVIEIPLIDLPILRPLSFYLTSTLMLLFNLCRPPACLYVRQMNSFTLPLFAKLFRISSFLEIPNDPYLMYNQKNKVRAFFEKVIDKISMKLATKVVVLSEWSKLRLNQIGGIPLSKITVVPSGTDTDLFRPLPKKECCRNLGLDPSFSYVGFVGSLFFHQGIDTLIESAPNILRRFSNTRFLLVGDGPMMETWKRKVQLQGLERAFIFPGQVPYKLVPEYIGCMDICVAPHRHDTNQASPVKIFDYMACGKPIVASDIEVVREIIGNSGCAELVVPESPDHLSLAIISLLQNSEKLKGMCEKAREYVVHNYDRKKITNKLILTLDNSDI
jgi:glycosyltransferase involved in cell wall biosynthesis